MTLKSIVDKFKSHIRNSHTVQARSGRKAPHLSAAESNQRIRTIQPSRDEIEQTERGVRGQLYAGRTR